MRPSALKREPEPVPDALELAPVVRSPALQAAFDDEARRQGFNPRDAWVARYVDYEWTRLRHMLRAYRLPKEGSEALEFGCNVGGSAIVLATLGAQVTALEVDPRALAVARANAARYGLESIRFVQGGPGEPLPFADDAFDLVVCNSVLEYVPEPQLPAVVAELTRVLRTGGRLLIAGTSNRVWPREMHSGRWFIHWLPRVFDRRPAGAQERGVGPVRLRRLLGARFHDLDIDDAGEAWLQARRDFNGGQAPRSATIIARAASLARIGPGWLTPSLSALLVKRF